MRLVRGRAIAATRRICVTFGVRSGKRAVAGARIQFLGRRKRTGRRGQATFCGPIRRGRHHAEARKAGYLVAPFTLRRR